MRPIIIRQCVHSLEPLRCTRWHEARDEQQRYSLPTNYRVLIMCQLKVTAEHASPEVFVMLMHSTC